MTVRSLRRAGASLAFVLLAAALRAQAPEAIETFDAVWRTVRDSHFDRTLNGVNWDRLAAELRPRAAAARSAAELRVVLRDMLGRLGQSHFAIIPSTAAAYADEGDASGTPGIDVRLAGDDLLVTHVDASAAGAGVRTGWKVVDVGGAPLPALLSSLPETLEPRMRKVEAWRLAQRRLRGPVGSTVQVTFENGRGTPVAIVLQRSAESGQPVTVGSLPTMFVRVDNRLVQTPGGRQAGLLRFNVWMAAVDAQFGAAVDTHRDADGIVIDLRGNPGGLAGMLMGISGHFINERKPLGVMKTRESELQFNVNPRRVNARGERVEPYAGPVAILVDDLSGSASECFAGGMQSLGRVRVFGQPTMGQALPALFTRLPNGDILIHAYADFITADGIRLEGRGVIPDEIVPLARADLLERRDRTLEAALVWIDTVARSGAHN